MFCNSLFYLIQLHLCQTYKGVNTKFDVGLPVLTTFKGMLGQFHGKIEKLIFKKINHGYAVPGYSYS